MTNIWIAALFVALISFYSVSMMSSDAEATTRITADSSAVNFMAYRNTVVKYYQANPAATGVIADATLAGFWYPGYIRDPNWTNLIVSGQLYVFSTVAVNPMVLDDLYSKSSNNVLLGTKNAVTGRLQSANGFDTGINLPAAIPNGAMVLMGS